MHPTHEELLRLGYKYRMSQSFISPDPEISGKNYPLSTESGKPVSVAKWARNTLELARGLGLLDLPVIEKDMGSEVQYTFYFRTITDMGAFDLGIFGVQYRDHAFAYPIPDEVPNEMCDSFVMAAQEFCDQYEIESTVEKADGRKLKATFNSNASFYAFKHALEQKVIFKMAEHLMRIKNDAGFRLG